MAKAEDNAKIDIKNDKNGLGVTIEALFKGMETLIQSKTVVGEPIEAGGALIIPLLEITAGMATGSLGAKNGINGAGAMNTKITPVALLIIQDGRTRLVSIKDQDVFTRLLDLIPEAIDKVKKGSVSPEAMSTATELIKEDADALSKKAKQSIKSSVYIEDEGRVQKTETEDETLS